MSVTATEPARNGRVYADEPPAEIRAALEAVVWANRGLFADKQAFKRDNSDSNMRAVAESAEHLDAVTKHAERLLDDYLPWRMNGMWPIAGRVVGFSPVSSYGMTLKVESSQSTWPKKGASR